LVTTTTTLTTTTTTPPAQQKAVKKPWKNGTSNQVFSQSKAQENGFCEL